MVVVIQEDIIIIVVIIIVIATNTIIIWFPCLLCVVPDYVQWMDPQWVGGRKP